MSACVLGDIVDSDLVTRQSSLQRVLSVALSQRLKSAPFCFPGNIATGVSQKFLQDEWSEIIPRLETLREDAARSSIPGELLGALPPSEILESEFRLHFEINRKGLLGLLDELIAWLQSALRKDKSVSILGL